MGTSTLTGTSKIAFDRWKKRDALEKQIRETKWYRFIRLTKLERELAEFNQEGFMLGVEIGLNNLEEMGLIKISK